MTVELKGVDATRIVTLILIMIAVTSTCAAIDFEVLPAFGLHYEGIDRYTQLPMFSYPGPIGMVYITGNVYLPTPPTDEDVIVFIRTTAGTLIGTRAVVCDKDGNFTFLLVVPHESVEVTVRVQRFGDKGASASHSFLIDACKNIEHLPDLQIQGVPW